jgi:uncharacterized protein (DUF885 family)
MKRTGALASLLLLGACATTASAPGSDHALNSLADRMVAMQVRYNPATAYFIGVPPPDNRRWPDRSPAAIAARQSEGAALLADLKRLDAAKLSPRSRTIHASMVEQLDSEQQMRVCRSELWDVSHMGGWHLDLVGVAREQPLTTAAERAEALQRWSALPALVEQEIANARMGLAEGYSAARPVVRKVVKQVQGLASAAPEKSPFYTVAERSGDSAFRAEFAKLLAGPVRQAFARYASFLESEYLPRAREALGVSANPNGRECYAASLRSYTTLPRPPEEVFRLGQQSVAGNLAAVRELGQRKFGTSDIAAITPRISQAPDNKFKSEEELIAFSRGVVAKAREKSASLFERMPEQVMLVEPFLAFQRGSGGSSFYEQHIDPKKPAFYRIASERWQRETRGSAEITAVHEGYPGHHMQISLANALGTPPVMKLSGNSAFIEGWARYSERLAEEVGIYETDYALMTRRLWPARGMVADPGLHVLGWTREQVIAFLRESGRFGGPEADDMVDRIAALPGQLTAYDSGGLEIMALREQAKQALGGRFDLRAFHQRVLENGSIPLAALRSNVEAWIAAERRRASR